MMGARLALLFILFVSSLGVGCCARDLLKSPRREVRDGVAARAAILVSAVAVLGSGRRSASAASTIAPSLAQAAAPSTAAGSVVTDSSFFNGLVSGAASRAAKEVLLHPLDTIKAREQVSMANVNNANNASASASASLYDGVSSALLGGVPAGALFFAVKDYSKQQFSASGLSKEAATLLAVTVANVPYWLIRCPSEVLKTQQQVNLYGTNSRSLAANLVELGKSGQLYGSYGSNLVYSLPADIIKFLVYEALTTGVLGRQGVSSGRTGQKIEGIEAAVLGAMAGLVSQVFTTPLDVARTRIMTNTVPLTSSSEEQEGEGKGEGEGEKSTQGALAAIVREEGLGAAFSGIKPRSVRALASGAIQFASYELTQNFLGK